MAVVDVVDQDPLPAPLDVVPDAGGGDVEEAALAGLRSRRAGASAEDDQDDGRTDQGSS
jgi:hypothetical protein